MTVTNPYSAAWKINIKQLKSKVDCRDALKYLSISIRDDKYKTIKAMCSLSQCREICTYPYQI